MTTYASFSSYYGGTSAETLRKYAARESDPERRGMFLKLAEEMDRGVIFHSSTEGGKLHYIRAGEV